MDDQDRTLSTRDIAGGTAGAAPEASPDEEARFQREDDATSTGTAADAATTTGSAHEDDAGPLLPDADQQSFVARWEEIQTHFVDDPRRAVEDADQLVAKVMQQLAEGFADERGRLEETWGRGEDVGTEDLRVALQRYRSFFRRLLSA
jgi:hypothetical protein